MQSSARRRELSRTRSVCTLSACHWRAGGRWAAVTTRAGSLPVSFERRDLVVPSIAAKAESAEARQPWQPRTGAFTPSLQPGRGDSHPLAAAPTAPLEPAGSGCVPQQEGSATTAGVPQQHDDDAGSACCVLSHGSPQLVLDGVPQSEPIRSPIAISVAAREGHSAAAAAHGDTTAPSTEITARKMAVNAVRMGRYRGTKSIDGAGVQPERPSAAPTVNRAKRRSRLHSSMPNSTKPADPGQTGDIRPLGYLGILELGYLSTTSGNSSSPLVRTSGSASVMSTSCS